jgi:ribonuclease P protein component
VSKSVGNAVMRNRVKRRLRHAVVEQMTGWPADVDVVVRATPKAAERDFSELGRDLAAAVDAARTGKSGRRPRNGAQRSPR